MLLFCVKCFGWFAFYFRFTLAQLSHLINLPKKRAKITTTQKLRKLVKDNNEAYFRHIKNLISFWNILFSKLFRNGPEFQKLLMEIV